jgi:chemotaxis protein MotB
MKNLAIILLSVLLAAALISTFMIYRQHLNTKDALLSNENKLSELNQEVIQFRRENSELRDQIRKNIDQLKELETAKKRISELKKDIDIRNQSLDEYEEKLQKLMETLEDEKKRREALWSNISSKEAMIQKLQQKFKSTQSRLSQLSGDLTKGKGEIRKLKAESLELEKQRDEVQALIENLKSNHAITESALNKEIQNRNVMIAEFKEKLKKSELKIRSLMDMKKKDQNEIDMLNGRISELLGEKERLKTKISQLQSTYNSMVSELENEIKNKKVTIKELEDRLSITFVDRILFEFGKATISPEGRDILRRVGNILKNVEERKVRVVGHTDNIPIMEGYRYKFPSNWELSAARAAAVVSYFHKEIGLDPSNLEAVGRSFYEPVASNETKEGRAQNRRVNIIIGSRIE